MLAIYDRVALVAEFTDAHRAGDPDWMAEVLGELFAAPGFATDGPRIAAWLAVNVVQTKGRFARVPLVIERQRYRLMRLEQPCAWLGRARRPGGRGHHFERSGPPLLAERCHEGPPDGGPSSFSKAIAIWSLLVAEISIRAAALSTRRRRAARPPRQL
ncbi:hypothetical protein [Patulibacter defluvii]|uniref:hypothetical protein n=1 Tax=Patulibacter defluvii TaxID=3095358 RepID=UPI002A76693A|nr:hypothetical protein [Patulibacter sp. DM4]